MTFPDIKNVTFVWFPLRPNFTTKVAGMPDFYGVKVDIIGFG